MKGTEISFERGETCIETNLLVHFVVILNAGKGQRVILLSCLLVGKEKIQSKKKLDSLGRNVTVRDFYFLWSIEHLDHLLRSGGHIT